MTNLLFSMRLEWDQAGRLRYRITQSFGDPALNITSGVLPIFPMMVSHQLAAYKPVYALNLCHKLFDYYENKNHVTTPINSALKYADIYLYESKKGKGARFSFKPKRSSVFANSDSLEEGSGQMVINYAKYSTTLAPSMYLTQIWALVFVGAVLPYIEVIKDRVKTGKISSSKLGWDIGISYEMAHITLAISKQWLIFPEAPNPEDKTESDEWHEGFQERFSDKYIVIKEEFLNLCTELDISV